MAFSLRSLLNERSPERQHVERLLELVSGPVGIYTSDDHLLIGEAGTGDGRRTVTAAGKDWGYLCGTESATQLIGEALELLLEKQYAQRQIGKEALHLYRQINLIYGFSEALARTIEPDRIAATALRQARQLIPADSGWVLSLDEATQQLTCLAKTGDCADTDAFIDPENGLAGQLLQTADADIIPDTRTAPATRHRELRVRTLLYAPLLIGERLTGLILLATAKPQDYRAEDRKLLSTLALQTASAIESARLFESNIEAARQREKTLQRIHRATEKFVPYDLLRVLGRESILDVALGDQIEERVSVMFADIRGYTTLSEDMTPDENFQFLNRYIGRVGPVITRNNGFIIRFLGDGILALFLDGCDDGIRAAIEMQQEIEAYNRQRTERGRQPIRVGIGMHQGPLIMGIMGNESRLEANIVSDTVNTASRMEGLTKYYGSSFILTETMLQNSRRDFAYRSLGKVQVKGKTESFGIYDVFEAGSPEDRDQKLRTRETFETGLEQYYQRRFEAATAAFARVLSLHPEDKAAQLYLSNAVRYHTSGVQADWQGIEIMEIK